VLGALVLATGVGLAGCPDGNQRPIPKTYPVRGKVVYKDGAPVTTAGRIEFQTPNELYHTILGEVQPDGTFSLYTLSNNRRYLGAPEGIHKVFVILPDKRTGEEIRVSAGECTLQPGDNDITLQIEKPQR
jgi:hypothetical protein